MTKFLSDDYSLKARMIMFKHYAKNDFTPDAEEVRCFWREMSVNELNTRIKHEWNFKGWRELKQSEHFGGLWNLPGGKVLLFADFESLPKIEMISLESAFNMAKLLGN